MPIQSITMPSKKMTPSINTTSPSGGNASPEISSLANRVPPTSPYTPIRAAAPKVSHNTMPQVRMV